MTKPTDPKHVEAGRKGGIASAAARRKRRDRGWSDAYLEAANDSPDEFAAGVLKSGNAMAKVKLLELAQAAQQHASTPAQDAPAGSHSLRDLLVTAARTNTEHLIFGITLTPEQRRELLVDVDVEGDPVPEKRRSPGTSAGAVTDAHALASTPENPPLPSQKGVSDGFIAPGDIPPIPPNDAEDRARAQHAANRAEHGLPPDDANTDNYVQGPNRKARFINV